MFCAHWVTFVLTNVILLGQMLDGYFDTYPVNTNTWVRRISTLIWGSNYVILEGLWTSTREGLRTFNGRLCLNYVFLHHSDVNIYVKIKRKLT